VTQSLADKPCIALEPGYGEPRLFTVAEYDAGIEKAQWIGSLRGLSFHGVIWARGAPLVERLTSEGHQAEEGRIRICDPEAYDLQMRKLLGIL
jgi:hypothetical protein